MGNNSRSFLGHPFHNATTQTENGSEIGVGYGNVTAVIAVTGNATGFTLVFEGMANDSDEYTSIMCANLATYDLSSTATTNGKYQMPLEGLVKIRTRLSAIATGAVTVKVTIVN